MLKKSNFMCCMICECDKIGELKMYTVSNGVSFGLIFGNGIYPNDRNVPRRIETNPIAMALNHANKDRHYFISQSDITHSNMTEKWFSRFFVFSNGIKNGSLIRFLRLYINLKVNWPVHFKHRSIEKWNKKKPDPPIEIE